jgi:hypothetical protein
VFFLPIGFVTSFFSIQLPDVLAGYDRHTYWSVFAVTISVSFLSLFFFSRLLMVVSDVMDAASSRFWGNVSKTGRRLRRGFGGKGKRDGEMWNGERDEEENGVEMRDLRESV